MRIRPVNFVFRDVDVVDADGVALTVPAMVPQPRYAELAKRQYHPGEEYTLVPLEARSRASHNQYFAAVYKGFENLPERIAHRFRDEDHLRLWLLVETKWCDEYEWRFADTRQAANFAKQYRVINQRYVRIEVHGNVVLAKHPKSQSAAAMGKTEFEASKRDVLDLLEMMTSVPKGTLMKEAGSHA